MNSQNNFTGSKYHQSPNHFQKKQESTTQTTAKQLLNQVPAKNLRNPDYYITSILAQPEIKKIDLINPPPVAVSKKIEIGDQEIQKLRKDFEASVIENFKTQNGEKLTPEAIQAEKEKFQKNYEEFFRGYTPDVNSFKRYDEIKNGMKQTAPEKQTLEELSKDPEFRKNMKQFFGDDGNEESNKKNAVAKKITSPKKDADLVKSIQNTKYNPINGKYY